MTKTADSVFSLLVVVLMVLTMPLYALISFIRASRRQQAGLR